MKPFIFLLFFSFIIQLNTMAQKPFPKWAEGIVWYQIFPERFRNGDPNNDPTVEKVFTDYKEKPTSWKITPWGSNWFETPEWAKEGGGKFNDIYLRRYGGDLQGIIDKLDYLHELGVKAIYLNPVFEAVSLHKYDASTYHHIDVNFGPDPEGDRKIIESEIPDDPATWKWTSADKLFIRLIEEVHRRKMYIIIDGVFNHTGNHFWAFEDLAKNQKNSKYKDWYVVKSFYDPKIPGSKFDYKGWWDVKSLPELNRTKDDLAAAPKNYIFNATSRWMDPNKDGDPSDGIDGWRLDVAREVPLGFWKSWSALVKSINSNAVLIGELWELSPDFVGGDAPFDALMNYDFARAVNQYFIWQKKKIKTSKFIEQLQKINKTYSPKHLLILQNLIDSHDTDRLSSMIINTDRQYDKEAGTGNPKYDPRKPANKEYEVQKLILAFQMTYIGAPMIYYGDEFGMWGADDPHCRKPMIWDDLSYDDEVIDENSGFKKGFGKYSVEQNRDLFSFYKKMIKLRNEYEALKKGDVEFIFYNDGKDIFAFEREYKNEKMIAVFNLGDKEAVIKLPVVKSKSKAKEILLGTDIQIKEKIKVPSGTFRLFYYY